MSALLLKIAASEWVNESRDKRELSAAVEAGFDVAVMAKGDPTDRFKEDIVDGYRVYKFSTRPFGDIPVICAANRVVSLFTWAGYARRLAPDVISGHDLIALLIGYLSCWHRLPGKRPALVYDSHEFELLRDPNRSKLVLSFIKHLERFLMKRCSFSIMVNDSIADAVQQLHGLDQRPLVIRSTPDKWTVDPAAVARVKKDWLTKLGMPEDTFVLMYHGLLSERRGIETMLDAVCQAQGTAAVILGNALTAKYEASLKEYCRKQGVANRTLFMPALPLQELWRYIGAADVGMIAYSTAVGNYRYLLPNKLFENIQAETPVICYDTLEVTKLVKAYDIGLLVDPECEDGITRALERLMQDKALYNKLKFNTRSAKEELCWEKEKRELVEAYRKLKEACA